MKLKFCAQSSDTRWAEGRGKAWAEDRSHTTTTTTTTTTKAWAGTGLTLTLVSIPPDRPAVTQVLLAGLQGRPQAQGLQ